MRKEYEWSVQLRMLRRQCGFDFAGLACAIRGRRTLLTWQEASGNRNRNYLKIVLEPGKGIAGGVFQRRKTMVVQNVLLQYSESERVHTPILLAEDIQSFVAFPLWKDEEVDAVLMLGMREIDSVTRERYGQVQQILSEGIFGRRVIPESYEARGYSGAGSFRSLMRLHWRKSGGRSTVNCRSMSWLMCRCGRRFGRRDPVLRRICTTV